jgi:methylenetetrahydrofolate dehydrogenase (NADP+)/methenyltetrahydrofolate cyclohydrolase
LRKIKNIGVEGVDLETCNTIKICFQTEFLGLNADYVNQYVQYVADRRLEELGLPKHYNAQIPAKWMSTATDVFELVNFFEAQNTSYEVDSKFETKPALVIIQVGNRQDSDSYIRQKKLFAEAVGAVLIHKNYEKSVTEREIIEEIEKYNKDAAIHGIIVQMPLPSHLGKRKLIEAIDPKKDIDGLTSYNTHILYSESDDNEKDKKVKMFGHVPATARGIISLLKHYKIEIAGKHVVVVGRSMIVGKPTALAFLKENATVTIAHKHTKNLPEITKTGDIVVVAIGDPEFITAEYVRNGQVIIDVGISQIEEEAGKKIVGDVRRSEVEKIVDAISPVPGGVGPMTVASLFLNLVDAYELLR